jgi:xanthine dehydrogenase YagR molybdenum-binding subunit
VLEIELKMDPIEFRPWSSKSLRECYPMRAERFGWSRRPFAPRSMRQGTTGGLPDPW